MFLCIFHSCRNRDCLVWIFLIDSAPAMMMNKVTMGFYLHWFRRRKIESILSARKKWSCKDGVPVLCRSEHLRHFGGKRPTDTTNERTTPSRPLWRDRYNTAVHHWSLCGVEARARVNVYCGKNNAHTHTHIHTHIYLHRTHWRLNPPVNF